MAKRIERDYFYLKGTEHIGDVVELLRKSKGKEIVLVVPPNSPVFLHPVHIEILAEEIKKRKKEVFVSTDDLKIIDLCRHYGIPLFLEEYKHKFTAEPQLNDLKVSDKKKLQRSSLRFNFNFLKPTIAILLLFLIGVIVVSTFQTKAKISITLAKVQKDFSEVVQTDDDALSIDLDKLLLPASIVDVEVTHTISVETTGKKVISDIRPRGLVEIQNYNKINLPLVAGTRLVYANKVYRIQERVIIPAMSGDEPGTLVVEVVGDKDYEDIIQPGTTFLIPGLQGTLWELLVKAVAKTEIKSIGGEVKVVNPEDITSVRLKLEKEIKERLQKEISLQYPKSIYPIEGGIFTLDLLNISHKVGEITDRISATGKGRLQTVVIKEDDLFSLIKRLVLKDEFDEIVENIDIKKLEILDINLAKNTSVLSIEAGITLLPVLNINALKTQINGKNIREIKEMFANDSRISKAEIEIFPSWRDSLPRDTKRIQIIVQ